MPIATGVFKKLIAKKQTGLGIAASGASAQEYRRVTSNLSLKKEFYKSNEIRASMMRSDGRHGVRSVDGTISGELSVGTYKYFIASTLRAASTWSAPVTSGALTTVAAAVTTGAAGTFTRSSGSWLTDGFKIGMVVRWTGWASPATANNNHNFIITALTSTVMTVFALDGVPIVAKAAGDSVTVTTPGRYVFTPTSGHTNDYWTIEHFHSDIAQSEQFTDCVFNTMDVKLPATGMATIDFGILGLNMVTGTSSVFTSPAAPTSGKVLAAVNGAVFVAGTRVATITSLDFQKNGNCSVPGGVVGSNVDPDIFKGSFDVTGNMSVLFENTTMRDYFLAETEVSIIAAFTGSNAPNADFIAITMPVVKINSSDVDDGEKGLTASMSFVSLENTSGGPGTNSINTDLVIQDSSVV